MDHRQSFGAGPSIDSIARAIFASLIVLGAVLVVPTAHAQTDEGSPPQVASLRIFRKTEGPYDVAIRVQPLLAIVGSIHFVITVLDPETASPVDGATVTIVAENPDGEPGPEFRAMNTPDVPEDYHVDLTVLFSGVWQLSVGIHKEGLGAATFQAAFLVEEPPPPPGQAGSVLWLIVFAALVGGILFLWNRSRKMTTYR